MLAAGLSIWAWGPRARGGGDATISPVPSQQLPTSRHAGDGRVVTGGARQAPPQSLPGGGRAPSFHLAGVGAAPVNLQGPSHPTVVAFMADWCVACHGAEPAVEVAFRRYGSQVAFLGVDSGDAPGAAASFVRGEGITFPVGLDGDQSVADRYGVIGLPQAFFVLPGGRIEDHVFGPLSPDEFASRVARLAGDRSPGALGIHR